MSAQTTPKPAARRGAGAGPAAPSTALAHASDAPLGLPGEVETDAALVDRAVEQINRYYAAQGLQTARAIGEYVLNRFFDGKAENFHRRDRKHVSFRALCHRKDLHVSYSWLYNAVAVVEQWDLLPADVRDEIPFTHQKLLLPVTDPETKERLAREVVKDGLAKRALEERIRKLRPKEVGVKRGRPKLPPFVKGLSMLRKGIAEACATSVTPAAFEHYDPKRARRLLKEVQDEIAGLQKLYEEVQAAAAAFEAKLPK